MNFPKHQSQIARPVEFILSPPPRKNLCFGLVLPSSMIGPWIWNGIHCSAAWRKDCLAYQALTTSEDYQLCQPFVYLLRSWPSLECRVFKIYLWSETWSLRWQPECLANRVWTQLSSFWLAYPKSLWLLPCSLATGQNLLLPCAQTLVFSILCRGHFLKPTNQEGCCSLSQLASNTQQKLQELWTSASVLSGLPFPSPYE